MVKLNCEKLYKRVFVLGYISVLVMTFFPAFGRLSSAKVGLEAFQIRLDFLLHFAVYFSICIYYFVGVKFDYRLFGNHSLVKFVVIVLFLALITEVAQLWIPSRAFNLLDITSNILGIVIGVIIIKVVRK